MSRASIFLIVTAAGLTPIALSYGLVPRASLQFLFDIDASTTSVRHIFRAIMGLYLALAVFWIAGARVNQLRLPALWSLVIFMFGLAGGRVLSLMLDGLPDPPLGVYLALEIAFGTIGLWLLRAEHSAHHSGTSAAVHPDG